MTDPAAIAAALAPVREALLAAARADADTVDARSRADAEQVLAAAREQADRALARAHQAGEADAADAVARDEAAARHRARSVVLRARRLAYEQLRADVREAAARLRDEPDYPEIRRRLAGTARRLLGPQAQIRDCDGGGVVAVLRGRQVDLSLRGFADRATDAVAAGLEET